MEDEGKRKRSREKLKSKRINRQTDRERGEKTRSQNRIDFRDTAIWENLPIRNERCLDTIRPHMNNTKDDRTSFM